MESKLILENLQRYTKELEERHPNETAYWHLQKLKNEIERVKNITHEPELSSIHTKWDCNDCKHDEPTIKHFADESNTYDNWDKPVIRHFRD